MVVGGYSTNNFSHTIDPLGFDSRASPARTVVVNMGNTSPRRHFAEISTINGSTERNHEQSIMADIIQLKNGVGTSIYNGNLGST
jgi:hypothetical protein